MRGLTKQLEYSPGDLNLSARAVASAVNSTRFGVDGFNQLTLEIFVDYAAATALTFFLESSNDQGSTWHRFQIGEVDYSTGVETTRDRQFSVPVSSADKRVTLNIPINHRDLRLAEITGTAATTDTVTVYARLGVV